jgi:hypothetical protein
MVGATTYVFNKIGTMTRKNIVSQILKFLKQNIAGGDG